jgi:glycosyltransferase involved in cell wall biosynthesis
MISVIVPVYNGEKTLQRCIDSIIESTVKDIEIILVENGSTDQTLKICQAYSNQYENIKTIVADVKGLSHARNLGMNAAKGDWIAFVDADDYISPVMYERCLQKVAEHHSDFVFGNIVLGRADKFEWDIGNDIDRNITVNEYCWNLFCAAQYKYSIVMNKLFSAELVKDFRFDETLRYTEDREFVFRVLSRVSSIGYIESPVYYYYQGNLECISKSSNIAIRIDQVHSLQKCLAFADAMFSARPQYGDYIAACLLQNADFRKKKAEEYGLTSQVEELNSIIEATIGRVRRARCLDARTKFKFLLEHDAPRLFHIIVKTMGKG